jgi:DNA-binding protein H-NS
MPFTARIAKTLLWNSLILFISAILAANLPPAINRFASRRQRMVGKKQIADIEKVIEEMTLQELVALKKGVDDWISTKQNEARDSFVTEMRQRAEQLGFDLGEMFGAPTRQRRSAASGTGQRAPAAIKYRNPANSGETWSGRGREPKWLTREMASGRRKEDFLIK